VLRSGHPRFPLTVRTSAGIPYRVRPIRPDDAARERDFINALSERSRYQRFMYNLSEAGDALVATLVNVDHHRTMALLAVTGDGDAERIIGVARYAADDDEQCEFAVVVADDWQCRGIGTTLARLLFDYAAHEGFKTIYGTVLADNQRMIDLAEWLGLTVEPGQPGEPTVRAWRRLQPEQKAVTAATASLTALVDPVALLLLVAANATPVAVARVLGPRLAAPIDAGRRLRDGGPLLGPHKTWRGLACGILACGILGAWLPCGAALAMGFGAVALAADLATSFVKRRMRWHSGHSAPLLDQLPESLLPLIVFGPAMGIGGPAVLGTALAFTLLDLAATRWRARPAPPA
jgi:RimJ/RimL family protein N-acetyltransferase